ncbi:MULTISPECIES: molybdate ABC transporter substrate-binding protein [unclassified Microbacterium]|uniref:molybdate ABC transporter substrate-binding protein n=1 Tax=unclassified Microbacterium TaxID=2609290 RepID=UPI001ACE0CA2|nr:molybdate ABC transporter substrate-binding protein [Microbacterium sp.]MBN9158926.1 molybdate ABC transporter substrate-binding protein [Microbacterium sp.]MBS1896858.1 molybdate ABC transporter substrate-binding protein [Actinomycetota bacterium]MBS1899437.1 molybdate ABC transporter substrate-binding protein [Actinomycetota bacterium]
MNPTRLRLPAIAATVLAAALALTACSTGSAPASTPTPTATTAAPAVSGELTVFAAASLNKAFDQITTEFEAANPKVHVNPITYDGSSTLATQIIEGAPVDVFASADQKNMDKVTQASLAGDAPVFTTNVLQIAVAPGNPLKVKDLSSLADPGIKLVLCAPAVPCGNAAKTLLDAAGVTATPVSEEQNVTAVLAKVKAGEADAGLVYTTDVKAAGSAVDGIAIAGADKAINKYPITVLKGSKNPEAAAAFQRFVLSDKGQKILADLGFGGE